MDTRSQALQTWLQDKAGLQQFEMEPMPNDASFRRYFRIKTLDGSFVAMDAPPPRENCHPYVAIAKAIRQLGLCAPTIVSEDVQRGFLLLTDFGSNVLLSQLKKGDSEQLYDSALSALAILQTCNQVDDWVMPFFTADFMRQELESFKEWFLQKHLNIQLNAETEKQLNACFDFLAVAAAEQPQVFMHRDYHSANLMVLPQNQIGILDFQDAFIGPVTYDLVSLLRDCYIDWPEPFVMQLVRSYYDKIHLKGVSFDQFIRWFDLMGLQRHLKALLTFSRKLHRDGSPNYLRHIPRTLQYVVKVSAKYPECKALYQFMSEQVVAPCAE